MYEAGVYFPLNFCSSVTSTRKYAQSVNKRPKIEKDLVCYLNNISLFHKNMNSNKKIKIKETNSTTHIAEFRTSSKRMESQKSGANKIFKAKNSPKVNCTFNIEIIKPKAPQSTKQQDKSSGQGYFVFPQPVPSEPDTNLHKDNNYERLVKLLEGIRKKSRCRTPCGQVARAIYKRGNLIEVSHHSSRKGPVRVPVKGECKEDCYESLENRIQFHPKTNHVCTNNDPYKINDRSIASRNDVCKTVKSMANHLLKSEDTKKIWRKCLNDNVESCNTATEKQSLLIEKIAQEEDNDDSNSEDKLTVIENDCDNDYELIYKCLQGKRM